MTDISLLMLTYNDVTSAIKTLEITRDSVSEQVIIDSSDNKNRLLLKAYAKRNPKVKIYPILALGVPETCLPYGISKCANEYIFLLDADEMPCRAFLEYLRAVVLEDDVYYITRYETPNKKFATKQLRLFRKGHLHIRGVPHEHIQTFGKKNMLHNSLYLMHQKPEGERTFRDYEHMQRLWYLTNRNRLKLILIIAYMKMKISKLDILSSLKAGIDDTQKTEEEKEITRAIGKDGIIKYLALDKPGQLKMLTALYKNHEQGPKLLLRLIREKYRQDKEIEREVIKATGYM